MKNVVLCFGGKSFEHDISIITALIVLKKYRGKYNLLPVYISKNQEWFFYPKNDLSITLFKNFDAEYKKNGFKKVSLEKDQLCYKSLFSVTKLKIDCVLNCCHGGFGEDGSLNALLEANDLSVTSGSSTALGICMDKILSKYFFKSQNVPFVDYFSFTKDEFIKDKKSVLAMAEELAYPVILKPSKLGSSIGIKVAHNETEFIESVKVALEFDNNILVEKAILEDMKEYNIALMKKNGKVIFSPIDVVKKTDEIFSFKDKYIGEDSTSCDKFAFKKNHMGKGGSFVSEQKKWEKIPSKIKKKIQKYAYKIYENLGLCGVVRFDFILDKNNNVFLNEVNSVPGSLAYYFIVPSIFKTMGEYIDCLIEEAIFHKQNLTIVKNEYITNII